MAEKIRYELEYILKTSSKILFNCISTPSGLSEWFSDDVNIHKDGTFTFFWDGSEEQAMLLQKKAGELMRFQWLDDEDTDCYFEFKIQIDPLTKEVALLVTDFAEEDEKDEAVLLWNNQVSSLKQALGA